MKTSYLSTVFVAFSNFRPTYLVGKSLMESGAILYQHRRYIPSYPPRFPKTNGSVLKTHPLGHDILW